MKKANKPIIVLASEANNTRKVGIEVFTSVNVTVMVLRLSTKSTAKTAFGGSKVYESRVATGPNATEVTDGSNVTPFVSPDDREVVYGVNNTLITVGESTEPCSTVKLALLEEGGKKEPEI
jgi:hypothetical protein